LGGVPREPSFRAGADPPRPTSPIGDGGRGGGAGPLVLPQGAGARTGLFAMPPAPPDHGTPPPFWGRGPGTALLTSAAGAWKHNAQPLSSSVHIHDEPRLTIPVRRNRAPGSDPAGLTPFTNGAADDASIRAPPASRSAGAGRTRDRSPCGRRARGRRAAA